MPDRGQALLDAVLAQPEDDAARAVYADWLSEQGQVRGEFIQIQLEGHHPTRQRRLIRSYQREWLGPIADLVRGQAGWERGFVTDIRIQLTEPLAVQRAIGAAQWRTVQRIRSTRIARSMPESDLLALFTHPVLNALQSHDGPLHPAVFWAWVEGPPRPLKHLSFGPFPAELPDALRDCPGLPELRSLSIRRDCGYGDDLRWLLDSPLGQRLEALEVFAPIESLGSWVIALERTPIRRFAITNFGGQWSFALSREDDGLFGLSARFEWDRVFDIGATSSTASDAVALALQSVPDGSLAQVVPEFRLGTQRSEDEILRLDAAIDRVTYGRDRPT